MKTKLITYERMIMEIAKLGDAGLNEPACIMAGVGEIDESSENYIDGAGVVSITKGPQGSLRIVVGDSGSMTWRKVITGIRNAMKGRLDSLAAVEIGYRNVSSLYDFFDEAVSPRAIEDCTMLDDDTIWNITLGPKV